MVKGISVARLLPLTTVLGVSFVHVDFGSEC